jgi:hypothetical protein
MGGGATLVVFGAMMVFIRQRPFSVCTSACQALVSVCKCMAEDTSRVAELEQVRQGDCVFVGGGVLTLVVLEPVRYTTVHQGRAHVQCGVYRTGQHSAVQLKAGSPVSSKLCRGLPLECWCRKFHARPPAPTPVIASIPQVKQMSCEDFEHKDLSACPLTF